MRSTILRNALILAATVFFVYLFLRETSKVYVLHEENKRIMGKIEKLEKENEELEMKIELLETDPLYIEKVAREDLGMIKKDEKVYKFSR